MALNEKEKTTIKDLQTQEQTCIKKYKKYGQDAKDPVLKELFSTLEKNEQKHYDTLGQILEGKVPECDCNDCEGKEYEPEATYDVMSKSDDKESDAFLATDSIGSENLYRESIIRMCLILPIQPSERFLQISRLRSRIMQKCFINIRLLMEWLKL